MHELTSSRGMINVKEGYCIHKVCGTEVEVHCYGRVFVLGNVTAVMGMSSTQLPIPNVMNFHPVIVVDLHGIAMSSHWLCPI